MRRVLLAGSLAVAMLVAACSGTGATGSSADEADEAAPTSSVAPPGSVTTSGPVTPPGSVTTGSLTTTQPPRVFPDDTTTGPDPAVELDPSESIEVVDDGTIVEDLRVTGSIVIEADDVTIRNVLVEARSRYAIQVDPETSGTVIEDVQIVGGLAEGACDIGIVYGHFSARRVDIAGCGDGIRAGSNTLLEDSWIHDMRDLPDDHSDGVQSVGGSNIVLRGNNIQMDPGMTSAMILHGHTGGDLSDVVVEDNLMAGGGYTLNIKERTATVENVTVRNNVWVRDSYNFGTHQGDAANDPAITTWEGNVFADGMPVG